MTGLDTERDAIKGLASFPLNDKNKWGYACGLLTVWQILHLEKRARKELLTLFTTLELKINSHVL